jgi:hypothetical protein
MNISIAQPFEDIAGDLVFVQPKFHFGQILEDLKGDSGFVIGMDFDGEWNYTLFYTKIMAISRSIKETELASSSADTIAITCRQLLER